MKANANIMVILCYLCIYGLLNHFDSLCVSVSLFSIY